MSNASYARILRASTIVGGAHGITYVVGLVRVKAIAVLLGTSGVGVASVYVSVLGLISAICGLGMSAAGVRAIAQAGDPIETAKTAKVLRRVCWAAGLGGCAVIAALAPRMSLWLFGSSEHAWNLAALGAAVLLTTISTGQAALLQGMRRVTDLARINVGSAAATTVVAVGVYSILGHRGIVPVIVMTAFISVCISWWHVRRLPMPAINVSWRETATAGRRLATLGAAIMWSGLLSTGSDVLTRAIITRQQGLTAVGVYQAAWSLSGMFAGFILVGLGAEFYPRLSAAIRDHDLASRAVNEQTEIGVLLALPGLLGTLALGPVVVSLLYSVAFEPAARVLPVFMLGICARVVSWPLAYIQLARGASRLYAVTETTFCVLHALLTIVLVPRFGVAGAACAFLSAYVIYTVANLQVAKHLIGFRWSRPVRRLLAVSSALVACGVGAHAVGGWSGAVGGCVVVSVGVMVSVRGLAVRLGDGHPLVAAVTRMPGGRTLVGS